MEQQFSKYGHDLFVICERIQVGQKKFENVWIKFKKFDKYENKIYLTRKYCWIQWLLIFVVCARLNLSLINVYGCRLRIFAVIIRSLEKKRGSQKTNLFWNWGIPHKNLRTAAKNLYRFEIQFQLLATLHKLRFTTPCLPLITWKFKILI